MERRQINFNRKTKLDTLTKKILFILTTITSSIIVVSALFILYRGVKPFFTNYLIVTHNMQQAARISDKTAFMYLGELIEYDDTDIIFEKPKHKKTQDYITGRFG